MPSLRKKSHSITRTHSTPATFPSNCAIGVSNNPRTWQNNQTALGKQYLLIISNRFTKRTKPVSLKSISASKVPKAFVRKLVFNYNPFEELHSDNGKCFSAKFFWDVCRIMIIQNSLTTTYYPQTNQQVERLNRTLTATIRSCPGDHPTDWDLYTQSLTYTYICIPHTGTAPAPFELVISSSPPPLALREQPKEYSTTKEAKFEWMLCLAKSPQEARICLSNAQERFKRNFDARFC